MQLMAFPRCLNLEIARCSDLNGQGDYGFLRSLSGEAVEAVEELIFAPLPTM